MSAIVKFLVMASLAGGAGYWSGTHQPVVSAAFDKAVALVPPAYRPSFLVRAETRTMTGPVIYYRDPDGKSAWSQAQKKTADGRDFVAVVASEDLNFNPDDSVSASNAALPEANGTKKIRFYRNPMGLPDTSPAPKKDSMGMDYIAVYEGEDSDDGSVKVSPGKLQRTGVRSEPVAMRNFTTPIRAPGTIHIDERRQSVMSLRFEGWIEKVEDVTTGAVIKKGQPLFRV